MDNNDTLYFNLIVCAVDDITSNNFDNIAVDNASWFSSVEDALNCAHASIMAQAKENEQLYVAFITSYEGLPYNIKPESVTNSLGYGGIQFISSAQAMYAPHPDELAKLDNSTNLQLGRLYSIAGDTQQNVLDIINYLKGDLPEFEQSDDSYPEDSYQEDYELDGYTDL